MEVDNCFVEMDSVEPPVADGSSLTFVKLIKEAGIRDLEAPRRPLVVQRQHLVQEDDKFIAIVPYDGFRITFTSINPHPLLGVQFLDTTITQESYVRDIAFARTIAFTEELEMLKKLGLGKGGTIENVVVYDKTSCLSVPAATMNWSAIRSSISSETWPCSDGPCGDTSLPSNQATN